jgi:hypothetical protein
MDKQAEQRRAPHSEEKAKDEKGRPPRHSGDDDVALDRAKREKDATASDRPEMDAIRPHRDTTAPGKTGSVPKDIGVAMPEDYFDPWADPATRPKGRDG